MEPDPSLMVEGNWLAASGQIGMETLLQRRSDIDAVFACNDSMALGVLYTACRLGFVIPKDLLLVGYDDTPEASSYWPSLTSVHQGLDHSGQFAVENLIQIIEKDEKENSQPIQQIIQPRLIIRKSSVKNDNRTG